MQADKHNVVNAQVEAYVMTKRHYLQCSSQRNYLAGHHERVRDKVCALAKTNTQIRHCSPVHGWRGSSLYTQQVPKLILPQYYFFNLS